MIGILPETDLKSYCEETPILRKETILFVIGSLEIGGAEKQLVMLLTGLKRMGCSCHVFALQGNGPLQRCLADLGVPVYSAGLKKGDVRKAPWKLIPAQFKLIRLVQWLKPRVVHSFLPLVAFMGALAGRLNRVPLVITSRRALGTHQDRFAVLRPVDLAANFLSHRVTVNSRAVWNDTVSRDHIDEAKLVLIYNGIDPEPFKTAHATREAVRKALRLQPNEKVVIVIANFIPYKGHLDLIKAARQVIDRIPDTKFLLVGEDRGIQKDVERQAQDLGISERVVFMGQRFDIPELLGASDLSVLPSHEEGFSNVILESMAAGLPVVATRVGGNAEAVIDGVTGWLVPPRNHEEMAIKIVDLLSNPIRAKSWGKEGRRRIAGLFTIDRMVKKHLNLYGLATHSK